MEKREVSPRFLYGFDGVHPTPSLQYWKPLGGGKDSSHYCDLHSHIFCV